MLSLINIAVFAVGIILVILSFVTYRRKGEAEISQDVLTTPTFIIGAILVVIAIIMKFIM